MKESHAKNKTSQRIKKTDFEVYREQASSKKFRKGIDDSYEQLRKEGIRNCSNIKKLSAY